MGAYLKLDGERVLLFLRVSPGAARGAIEGEWRGPDGNVRLAVRVTAAPEGGKANDAVIRLIARRLGLKKSAMSIAAGTTSRLKTLAMVTEEAPERMLDRLQDG